MKSIYISIVLLCLFAREETYSQWIQTEGPLDSLNIFFLMPTDSSLYVGTNCGLHVADSIPGILDRLHNSKFSCYALNGSKAFFGGYETGIIFFDLSKLPLTPDTFQYYTTFNTMICNDSCLYAGNTLGFYKCIYGRGSDGWGLYNRGLPVDSVVFSSGWVQKIYHINAIEQIEDTIFCATHKGIFRTTANNPDWKPVNYGLPEGSYQLLKVINDTIFAGINQTLYYSVNSGNTWDSCFSSPSLITSVYRFKEVTYITTKGNGIYSSRNGTGWTTLNSGLGSLNITTIQLYKNTLVCGTLSDGLYFLNNNTWNRNNRGMIYTHIWGISSTGKSLFSCLKNRIYISMDGSSWKEITPKLYYVRVEEYPGLCAMNDLVFVSALSPGRNFIYYSQDNGIGWDSIPYIPTKRNYPFNIAC
jgi:hypothetical protein